MSTLGNVKFYLCIHVLFRYIFHLDIHILFRYILCILHRKHMYCLELVS